MRAGAEHIKHVTLELGGKNPMIICDDMDPAVAAQEAVNGMNMRKTMGQSCQSNSRVFVHESIADEFIEHLAVICNGLIVDDPRSEATEMGPLGFPGHYERVLSHIRNAVDDGARLVCGGSRPAHLEKGCYVAPTVFADVNPDMRLFREEVFGPVMAVIPWSDEDEMMDQVNSLDLGLTARIWTRDAARANRLVARVQSGLVGERLQGQDPRTPVRWLQEQRYRERRMPRGADELHEGKGCDVVLLSEHDSHPRKREHMRGLIFTGNRESELREFPDPRPGPGEAVITIRASGLCGSDLLRYRGTEPSPTIIGHEPCGVVAELGPGSPSSHVTERR